MSTANSKTPKLENNTRQNYIEIINQYTAFLCQFCSFKQNMLSKMKASKFSSTILKRNRRIKTQNVTKLVIKLFWNDFA